MAYPHTKHRKTPTCLNCGILLKNHYATRCKICNGIYNNHIDVHHIDYNKKNNNINNLITLCKSCHPKTNFNRKYWKQILKNKLEGKTNGSMV